MCSTGASSKASRRSGKHLLLHFEDGTSMGLHGGRWSYEGDDPVVFNLHAVEFVPDVAVSGTVRWSLTGEVGGRRLSATMPAP